VDFAFVDHTPTGVHVTGKRRIRRIYEIFAGIRENIPVLIRAYKKQFIGALNIIPDVFWEEGIF